MSNILDEIVAHKKSEVAARKKVTTVSQLSEQASQFARKGFLKALQDQATQQQPGIIAEIKKASPSEGIIRENFDPVAIAADYQQHNATCLSVLTDEKYFQGSDQYLKAVRKSSSLPIIRKDFIVDEYQIYESAALGADCILLIASALDIMQLTVFNQTAKGLGLDVLIEVHNEVELEAALSQQPKLVGINNRNLGNFSTALETTTNLLPMIPDSVTVVTESAIKTHADVQYMLSHNVYCFLVGTAFMRQPSPGQALTNLFYG